MEVEVEKNNAKIKANPRIYPISVIYAASYVFLDRAYIRLDGDPEKEVIVEIEPKTGNDAETMGKEFLNELINYADYERRAQETRKIREVFLQRSLLTNDPQSIQKKENFEDFDKLMEELDDDDFLDDPEGIAIPWEEKYGKKAEEEQPDKKQESSEVADKDEKKDETQQEVLQQGSDKPGDK